MPKYYEVAKMNQKGKLTEKELVQANTWEEARKLYKKTHGGEDYQIFIKE